MYGRISRQRGLGMGSFLMSVLKRAKQLLKVLGSKAVEVAGNIAQDTISGKSFKEAAVENIKSAIPENVKSIIPEKLVPSFFTPESTPTILKPNSDFSQTQTQTQRKKKRRGRGFDISEIKRKRDLHEIYPGLQLL